VSFAAPARDGRARAPGTVLAVECEGLSYRFGGQVAVDEVHLQVDEVHLQVVAGEVFGLLGPNGAGKTTAIRVLTTLLPAAGGSARIFGLDVAGNRSPRPWSTGRGC